MRKPLISVVLGTYNRLPFLRATLNSIRRSEIHLPYEIVVIDGGSEDGTVEFLVQQKDVVTIVQHNRNKDGRHYYSWGYFMNTLFKASRGQYIVMLSDDCLVHQDAIVNGYNVLSESILRGKPAGAGAFYWRNYPFDIAYYVRATLGGYLSVNHGIFLRSAVEQVGFFDEDTFRFYYADGDLSLRLWQNGYAVVACPGSFVEHFEFANCELREINMTGKWDCLSRYKAKWRGVLYRDNIDIESSKSYLPATASNVGLDVFDRQLAFYDGPFQLYTQSLLGATSYSYCVMAIFKRDSFVLMGLQSCSGSKAAWTFPGGRVEAGETLIQALMREVREETGIDDLVVLRFVGEKHGIQEGDVVFFFECSTNQDPALLEPAKFSEWRWQSIEALPVDMLDAQDVRFVYGSVPLLDS